MVKISIFTGSLLGVLLAILVVQCAEVPTAAVGPYIPAEVKGDDGRRILWEPKPGEKQKCSEADFSPDGTKVVVRYWDGESTGGADLAILDVAAGAFKVIVKGNYPRQPRWSPTGEWIAYQSTTPGQGIPFWLVRPDGSDNHKLDLGITSAYVPYWGPEGDKIYFVGLYEPSEPLYALYYDLKENRTKVLRKPKDLHHNAVVPSPGGEKIALGLMPRYSAAGNIVLALINADGTGFEGIWPGNDDAGGPLDWSPDGEYVLLHYESLHNSGSLLWTYELKTGAVRQLTMCPPDVAYENIGSASWGPSGDIVFNTQNDPDGRLYVIKGPE